MLSTYRAPAPPDAEVDDSKICCKSSDPGAVHSLTLIAMQDRKTSLHVASCEGRLSVAQFLVDSGAKLQATDKVWFISISYHPHTSRESYRA
jgi:hypothetical protein